MMSCRSTWFDVVGGVAYVRSYIAKLTASTPVLRSIERALNQSCQQFATRAVEEYN